MKRILFYIIIIAASFLFPLNRADVGKLQPVEAVAMYKTGDQLCIVTDAGDCGTGKSAYEAIADLKKNSAAIVYLDTAKYLLVSKDAETEIDQIKSIIKPTVRLCGWNGEDDLKVACKYFSAHDNLPRLFQWKSGTELPMYYCEKM